MGKWWAMVAVQGHGYAGGGCREGDWRAHEWHVDAWRWAVHEAADVAGPGRFKGEMRKHSSDTYNVCHDLMSVLPLDRFLFSSRISYILAQPVELVEPGRGARREKPRGGVAE